MVKATVHSSKTEDSSSDSAIKPANHLVYVTDSKGRKLGLRRLPFLEEFRIVETVGPERAVNQVYMGMLKIGRAHV